jgi:positive regulator of sigma E activity
MIKKGTVVAIKGDKISIEILRSSACGGCSQKSCNYAPEDANRLIVELPNPGGLAVSQIIDLEMADSEVTRAAFTAYGLPLAGFLLGALLPSVWSSAPTDMQRALSAFSGLIFGFLLIAFIYRKINRTDKITIVKQ